MEGDENVQKKKEEEKAPLSEENNEDTKKIVKYERPKKNRRCVCDTDALLAKISGVPPLLSDQEYNKIRLNLFTERNSDGSGYLVLRGRDIFEKFQKRIQDSDIRAICIYVRELPRRITKIDLCYNEITDVGFFKLLKKLLVKGRSSVINLNIMNNELTDVSAMYLARYAKYLKLKYLRMNGNKLGTKSGEHLAKFLENNSTVEYLDIGQTGQTQTSVAPIVTSLRLDHGKNDTLKVLDFSRVDPLFDRYSYETKWLAYHIEYLLERNNTLIELHLQKNELIGHDVEFLVRGLRRNKTLLYLDLGFNKIGEYGAELLAQYFSEQPNLRLLNISANGIADTGIIALAHKLPFSKLRAIDISRNKISDSGLVEFLNTIKKWNILRFLNIWGNQINVRTCGLVNRMLQSGVLTQNTLDIKLYKVDGVFYAAYYPNPLDRSKHFYYCELEFGNAQPIYHIKRNQIVKRVTPKVQWRIDY